LNQELVSLQYSSSLCPLYREVNGLQTKYQRARRRKNDIPEQFPPGV